MIWLSQNWIWVLIFAAFIGMHMFGHGGHGGHSRGQERHDAGKEGNTDGRQLQRHHH